LELFLIIMKLLLGAANPADVALDVEKRESGGATLRILRGLAKMGVR
jgi:hypothetical protein